MTTDLNIDKALATLPRKTLEVVLAHYEGDRETLAEEVDAGYTFGTFKGMAKVVWHGDVTYYWHGNSIDKSDDGDGVQWHACGYYFTTLTEAREWIDRRRARRQGA